jgi:hypothetical protein
MYRNLIEAFKHKYMPLLMIASLIMFVIYGAINAMPSVCGGMGDCVKYSAMASAFLSGDYLKIDYPFNLRVLAPLVASSLPYDVERSFLIINAVSAIVFIFFLHKTCQTLGLGKPSFIIISGWFLVHPSGFPFYYAIPISVDPLAYALMSMTIYFFIKHQPIYLAISLLLGLLTKESFLFIAITAMASTLMSILIFIKQAKRSCGALFIKSQDIKIYLNLLIALLVASTVYSLIKSYYILSIFPQAQSWTISSLGTIFYWAVQALKDPSRIVVWIGSFFVATGVFSVLLLEKKVFNSFVNHPVRVVHVSLFLTFGSIGYITLGILAGSDMTRIIFNGNLFIFFFIFTRSQNDGTYIALVSGLSFFVALSYMRFFPSAFEYGYYSSGSVKNTTWFVVLISIAIFSLVKFRKKFLRA